MHLAWHAAAAAGMTVVAVNGACKCMRSVVASKPYWLCKFYTCGTTDVCACVLRFYVPQWECLLGFQARLSLALPVWQPCVLII
jgi:hypothetical protein